MHVLQLVPRLEVGGVERGLLDLTKGLLAQGHRVSVVSAGGSLVGPLERLGAAHYTLPIDAKSIAAIWRTIPEVARLIRQTSVGLVHARSRVPAWVGYVAARRMGVPFVTTCHGFYRPHPGSSVMTWGRLVIAPSNTLGRYLIERFRVSPGRLRVIPRGVDLAHFPFRPHDPNPAGPWRIGLVGRLTALKGHDVALRALAHLIKRHPSITLAIVGDAPAEKSQFRRTLQRLAEDLGVARAVEWLGIRYDVAELLASFDIVIAPSLYPESFGRSVIEAQAVGRPVVASKLGALAEIIEDGTTGLLVHPGDPVALAEAIERLVRDEPLRRRLVDRARGRVEERFALERMVHHTLQVYEECLTKPRILIWKLSAVGDVILAAPSFRAIRRHAPGAHISLVTGRLSYEVVARCPYVNEIIVYDPTRKDRGIRGRWTFLRRLRAVHADLSIDLQNSRDTHAWAWLAGIPVRMGYDRRWGWLLNRGVRPPRQAMSPIAHQQHLLRALNIPPDGDALELWTGSGDEEAASRLIQEATGAKNHPCVGIHPGGSLRWRTKRWDLARWATLCDRLAQQHVRVIVTGGPEERELGEALVRLTSSEPFVAIGKTNLMELACLIKRCRVFVTHDSAPLHLAAAAGVPTVALFGPTDPARHVPDRSSVAVIKKDVFCSPCYSTRCRTITHACMKRIGVEEVATAVQRLLESPPLVEPMRPFTGQPAHPA